jgi:molecular chaperone DnaK
MASDIIIGIDLGTTNSVVAVMEGKEVKVIPNQEGHRLTPSVVAFTDKGDRLVGELAKRQAVTNPRRTVYSIKRFMGRRRKEVAEEEKLVPYKIVGAPEEPARVEIDGKTYAPPEISAMVLRKLKEAAEAYLGQTVNYAVITVPAYFNDAQRQATLEAAQIAGFKTEWELQDPATGKVNKQRMRIINEPTAAALAYGLDKKKNEKIAVFDLGGGTFDISILDVGDGVFRVEAVNGDTHLGGDDFDQVLIDYVAEDFKKQNGIDLRKEPMALQRLKEACEQAKKDLSQAQSADIHLPFITTAGGEAKHLQMSITRSKFEQLVDHLIDRCRGPVMKALQDAKLKPSQIDEVVLVGGMTRVPKVQWLVKDIFGKEGHKGVNPDEVVAVGAAIQGAQLLLGSKSDVLLVDVTPLSLGIEANGGQMAVIIPRNTSIPTSKTDDRFTTMSDNQPSAEIHVLQGERQLASANRSLGRFHLDNLPPASRGTPRIAVTFALDANGILNVSAKEMNTNKEASIRIEGSSGLDTTEVERMRKDAESHADEDKRRIELINARNEADNAVYQVEKILKEHGDKLSEANKAPVQAAMERVHEKMKTDDTTAIKRATEELATASQGLAQFMQGGGAQGAGPSTTPGDGEGGEKKGKDDVIDAEFEVKK